VSDDARIAESVGRHGWHAIAVEGTQDEPPFSYTIGLCDRLGHPELVVLGLEARVAHGLLADVVSAIRSGRCYGPGESYLDVIQGYSVLFLAVHRTQVLCRLGYALAYYRRLGNRELLRAVQLVWPDQAGRLPTEPGCEVVSLQPRLDDPVPEERLRAFFEKYGRFVN
jgi:hypothetical protein